MGTITKKVEVTTCDLCGAECDKDDACIDFAINGGDGRDVGPTRIQGRITLYQPYRCDKGILCRKCAETALRNYLDRREKHDAMLAASQPAAGELNQCDGCRAGMPLDGYTHRDAGGRPIMVCQSHMYRNVAKEEGK